MRLISNYLHLSKMPRPWLFAAVPCSDVCVSLNPNVLSGCLGLREIKHFSLNTLEHGISNEGAGTQDLNPDEFSFCIELRCNIWANLNTARSWFIRYFKMKNVIFLKVYIF